MLNVPLGYTTVQDIPPKAVRESKGCPQCQEIQNVFVHLHTSPQLLKLSGWFVFYILHLQTPDLSSSPRVALLGIWLLLAVPEATKHPLCTGYHKELKGCAKS